MIEVYSEQKCVPCVRSPNKINSYRIDSPPLPDDEYTPRNWHVPIYIH